MIYIPLSGEYFETDIHTLNSTQDKLIKKKDWLFDWKKELTLTDRQLYALVTKANPKVIQGLVSITDNEDHIFLHLIENAKFNRGPGKLYQDVAENLFAFACKVAFEKEYDGIVVFFSKSNLVAYYSQALGARQISGLRLYIPTHQAKKLVVKHFPDFKF